jgi:riboflavin biosynthesis pyrimidine reductase
LTERPFVLLSCAASVDGYIDDSTEDRLLLQGGDEFHVMGDREGIECRASIA